MYSKYINSSWVAFSKDFGQFAEYFRENAVILSCEAAIFVAGQTVTAGNGIESIVEILSSKTTETG